MSERIQVDPEYREIYELLKDDLHAMWRLAARYFGLKLDNLSPDHPFCLIEEEVTKTDLIKKCACFSDPENHQLFIRCVLAYEYEVLAELYEKSARKLNKRIEDLTYEERECEMYHAFDYFIIEIIFWALYDASADKIIEVTKENPTVEDFKETVFRNFDRMDFDKQWNHTRTAIGAMLSLDAMTEAGEEFYDVSTDDDTAVQSIDYIESFIATLDEPKDKKIVRMLLDGKKQERIANELGYSSQSAVSKRIKQIREQLSEYRKKH